MEKYQNELCFLGRVLIATMFLPAGIAKCFEFKETAIYFESLGMMAPTLCVVIAVAVEILGGIALLVGFHVRLVAIFLALYTFVASVTGHAFWAVSVDLVLVTKLLFFKNIAVIGGLLILASSGAGKFSIDYFKRS